MNEEKFSYLKIGKLPKVSFFYGCRRNFTSTAILCAKINLICSQKDCSFVVPLCFDFPSLIFLQKLSFFLPSERISLLMFAFILLIYALVLI